MYKTSSRYGDECLSGRVSLLHFCVIFLLAGTITLTVGLVQYKPDAELFQYRQTIVILGCISFTIGSFECDTITRTGSQQ